MRAPVRSETDAFRLALGAAVVILAAVALGALTSAWAGVALVVAAAVVAGAAYVVVGRRDRAAPLRAAEQAPHPEPGTPGARHVLVVANEPLAGPDLRNRILRGGRVEIHVLSPVLTSRLHLGVTDIDQELAEARERLDRSLAWARAEGIPAQGRVGDPSPTTALEDELRAFGPDEVIVVTHARSEETWQERAEVERLRRELDVPVGHITAG